MYYSITLFWPRFWLIPLKNNQLCSENRVHLESSNVRWDKTTSEKSSMPRTRAKVMVSGLVNVRMEIGDLTNFANPLRLFFAGDWNACDLCIFSSCHVLQHHRAVVQALVRFYPFDFALYRGSRVPTTENWCNFYPCVPSAYHTHAWDKRRRHGRSVSFCVLYSAICSWWFNSWLKHRSRNRLTS